MFSQKQKTDVMISNVANNVKGVNGADGADIAAAGEKLLFKQLLPDGTYRTSGIIKPSDVKYISKQVEVTAAASTAVFTCAAKGKRKMYNRSYFNGRSMVKIQRALR